MIDGRKEERRCRKKRLFVREDLRFVGAGMVLGALWLFADGAARPLSAVIGLGLGALFMFIGGMENA